MTNEELNELASNKIYSIYSGLLRQELLDPEIRYWSIDADRAKEINKSHTKEVEVWSYILTLIEKDNKL